MLGDGLKTGLNAPGRRGIVARELSRGRKRDALTATITALIAGALAALAHFGMCVGQRDQRGSQSR